MFEPSSLKTLRKLKEANAKASSLDQDIDLDGVDASDSDSDTEQQIKQQVSDKQDLSDGKLIQTGDRVPSERVVQNQDEGMILFKSGPSNMKQIITKEESQRMREQDEDMDQEAASPQQQMRQTNTSRLMNSTTGSFSGVNVKVLDEAGGQIRSITGTAEAIKQRIKEQLKNQDDDKEQFSKDSIYAKDRDDEEEVKVEYDLEKQRESQLKSILESRKNLGIGGQRLQEFMGEEKENEDEVNHADGKGENEGEVKNFLTKLYEDDSFRKEREIYEQ